MKAMFAWMSLLAALANLFAVASGQPDPLPPPLPAILKTSVAGVQDLETAMDIGPAEKLPIKPENDLESGKLIAEGGIEQIAPKLPDASQVEFAKGSILENDLKTARYVANPEKVLEKLLSDGEGIPEIKQGKIIAGDPAELDVLTLKKRRGEPELPMKQPEKPKMCAKDSDCKPGEFCEMIVVSPFITFGTCQAKQETATTTTTTTRTPALEACVRRCPQYIICPRVCGTNGKTYCDLCRLRCAQMMEPSLKPTSCDNTDIAKSPNLPDKACLGKYCGEACGFRGHKCSGTGQCVFPGVPLNCNDKTKSVAEPDLPVEAMDPSHRSHGCITDSDCKAGEYCKNAFPVGTSCWAGPVCFCVPKPM